MVTVFLGGTCNKSTWREELISLLDIEKVNAFNPIVDNWNEESQQIEIWHRNNDDLCLYVLTPEMEGFYSIAEVVDDSNKRPAKTILCILPKANGKEFNIANLKGILMLQKMVAENGATVLQDLGEVANYLNSYQKNLHL